MDHHHDDDLEHEEYDENGYSRPSKSELKRRVEALQKAGESLIDLPAGKLASLNLPDELHKAVTQAAKLRNKHAAFKRQRQFIGRLMRELDATPILEALEELQNAHSADTARFHEVEHWRDALLGTEGATALTELIAAYPGADVQALRNLVGKARRELDSGRGKHAQRELFAMLRGLITQN